jgi:hypothetical protein
MQNTEIWHDVPCAYNNISYYMCETNGVSSGHTGMLLGSDQVTIQSFYGLNPLTR